MSAVARLLTFVDIADEDDDGRDTHRISVSARHEAVLEDGHRVVLLNDRGWSEELRVAWQDEPSPERGRVELPGLWMHETVQEMERTARTVVGPDEPFEGRSRACVCSRRLPARRERTYRRRRGSRSTGRARCRKPARGAR